MSLPVRGRPARLRRRAAAGGGAVAVGDARWSCLRPTTTTPPRSPTWGGRSSRTGRRRPLPTPTARSCCSRRAAAAASPSRWPPRWPALRAAAWRSTRSASSCPRSAASGPSWRLPSRLSTCPSRWTHASPCPAPRSASRSSGRSASPGSRASGRSSSRSCAARSRACFAAASTTSRAACAGGASPATTRCSRPSPSTPGPDAFPAIDRLAGGRGLARRPGRLRPRDGARRRGRWPHGSCRSRPAGTSAPPAPCWARSTSCVRWSGRSTATSCSWRCSASTCASAPRPSRAGWRCSTCAGRARAASRSRSSSGSRRGRCPGAGSDRRVLDAAAAAELGVDQIDPAERERHLFTIACTRPWRALYLARQAATDDGRPLEPSPFWSEVVRVLGDQSPALVRRRGLADVSWPLQAAPSERERLRALTREMRDDPDWATGVAAMMGWERKLRRAATRHQARLPAARPRAPGRASRRRAVLGDRARALRRLLVDVVRRPRALAARDRLRARRPHARLDRPRHARPLLHAAARRARPRAADGGRPAGGLPADAPLPSGGARRPARARLGRRQGARPGARARPRRVPARRGRARPAARPAPVRGPLRRRRWRRPG